MMAEQQCNCQTVSDDYSDHMHESDTRPECPVYTAGKSARAAARAQSAIVDPLVKRLVNVWEFDPACMSVRLPAQYTTPPSNGWPDPLYAGSVRLPVRLPAQYVLPSPVTETRTKIRSHTSYLSPLVEEAENCIARFRQIMRKIDYDTLVGTGLSGALAVPMFARAVGVDFAIVRKNGDGTHSHNVIEGNIGKRWVFVDDLVCSGDTRARVKDAMTTFSKDQDWPMVYVGEYLYYDKLFKAAEADGNV